MGAKEIHARKGLKKNQEILDHMGSAELAANLFRATQTDEKLRRENIKDKATANKTHYEVGRTVRRTIQELGGTMPEDLPTPQKSIKQIEREQKKKENAPGAADTGGVCGRRCSEHLKADASTEEPTKAFLRPKLYHTGAKGARKTKP